MQAKATFTREADYRRERDFGAKISATFDFVAAQFRPLVKCVLYFVLPCALLAGIGMGLIMGGVLSNMPLPGGRNAGGTMSSMQNNPFSVMSFVGFGFTGLGFLLAFLLLSSTVYAFVRVRMNTAPTETVQPRQVWDFMWPRLGRVLGAWLLLGIIMVVGMGVVSGILALAGPGFVVLIMFPLLWIIVCLTMYFPALWMEDGGVTSALRRTFYLIKGKWWSTLGLYMVMSFITGTLNYVFIIPIYGLMMARFLVKVPGLGSEILTVAAMSFYALGWVLTAVLPLMAMLFQYFNLVERKDGVGLLLLVDSLGQTPAPQASNAAYQPDDEGEY